MPAPTVRVAIVDADPTARRLMRHWLESASYEVSEATTRSEIDALVEQRPDIVCMDFGIAAGQGVELLTRLHKLDPGLPVIVVTSQRDIESAVTAMRAGAHDYVAKPLDAERLLVAVQKARDRRHLMSEVSVEGASRILRGAMAGKSRALRDVEHQLRRVLDRDVAVMLHGEHGAGTELVAAAIHAASARTHGPFVVFDAGTHDPSEHEALLAGRDGGDGLVVRGAFEQASGGVVYLEQVEKLSCSAQAQLAAYLSGKGMRHADGGSEFVSNVRVLAGSSRDLRELVESGSFSEELFFRLVVYPIAVPPLRERRADIPSAVGYYLRAISGRMGDDSVVTVQPEAMEALVGFDWPGNLRELENVVHRSLLAASGQTVTLADLPAEVRGATPSERRAALSPVNQLLSFPDNEVVPLRELERLAIEHALRVTHGSVTLAAKRLGIGRATLYRRIATLELTEKVA